MNKKKKQLVLIGVLSVGLVIALVLQPSDTEPSNGPPSGDVAGAAAPSPALSTTPTSGPVTPVANSSPSKTSSEGTLVISDAVADYWLDRKPDIAAATPQRRVTQFTPFRSSELRSVAKAPPPVVRAIYGRPGETQALIGDAIMRSGQPLPDGRRILDVAPHGVRVSNR
ncbi:MAG: hypothetical protein AAGA03_11965 [Planctomycetota bacterium]